MDTPLIHTDPLHLIAYATDASTYREMPLGVSYPADEKEIQALIHYARQQHTHLIPRAGGTSIAGQVVGNGIVVDISRHFNKILEINAEERWARVQPGVVRDELNLSLKPYGLFFSPETSTSNRCCIGGMVGNNSCGTHSLIYGSTRHHLLQIKGFLSDGSAFDTAIISDNPLEKAIRQQLQQWHDNPTTKELIFSHFPDRSLRRRSCGYAIDEALDGNLCNLICGSEGTLCFITEIKLSLDPLPSPKQMVLCVHCNSLPQSYQANLVVLRHNPTAIELMDGKILELCKNNLSQRKNRFFIQGEPAALIIAEFNGDRMEEEADATEKELLSAGLAYHCSRVYGDEISCVWALRKAGLGVLTGVVGDEKPVGVIEDTAVSPQRLPDYLDQFEDMLKEHGLQCVYYGHIGTGELHLRPILNIKTQEGRKLFRTIAEETAFLVKKHHGSLSGEHGDGRLRGEFIPLLYGKEVYRLMCDVKQCWDPDGVFNRGKIVHTPPMDTSLRYEVGQQYHCHDIDLMGRIEQCNGAGDCRKSNKIGGTLCPAFKVSNEELKSTRARANVLREVLTRGGKKGHLSKEERKMVEDVLYSCLACKGCKSECPSNVDMTRIRSEVLQMVYDREGTPFRSWMVARMAMVEQIGSMAAPLYNLFATWKPTASLIKQIVRFTPERSLPKVYKAPFPVRDERRDHKVCLFLDEFTRYNEPHLAQKLIALLEGLGYQVVIPKHVESGRAAISKGCLHLASRFATKNVRLLKDIVNKECPLIGIEPSCILSFRDEYPRLVSKEMKTDTERLAANCLLYDEFIMREVAKGNIRAEHFYDDPVEVWLHGHCHQKALVGIEKTASMLRLLPNIDLHVIPSGCCGMAGSFGYEKEHYKTSMAIGEMVLFPTIRTVIQEGKGKQVIVAAPGTSCRQQILDGTGIHAFHPIEIMHRYLNPILEEKANFACYKGCWMNLGSEATEQKLSTAECKQLLKKGGFMVRNVYEFDCGEETQFWYVIKDRFGGMEELSSKMRNQVRRSMANFEFGKISREQLLQEGYPIHCHAAENYRVKSHIPSREDFEAELLSGVENEFWGAWDKESKQLIAFVKNQVFANSCNYSVMKAEPEAVKRYVYYGLIYEMNRYYLEECGMHYVNDGGRSITGHSNIQTFLIEKFNFRKAYCQVRLTYNLWMRITVWVLYPFRNIIPIASVKSILNQEQMNRR